MRRNHIMALAGTITACIALVFGFSSCERRVDLGGDRTPRIIVNDVAPGAGAPVEEGRRIDVHYIGSLPDGTVFLNTYDRGKPHGWTIGDGTVIIGMDLAVRGMRLTGVREVVIPPELHWGRAGYAGIVPHNTPVRFKIELVAVR